MANAQSTVLPNTTWPNYPQPYPRPYVAPTVYPNYTIQQISDPEAGRLRFALELIAEGGLTKEAMEKIAKRALAKDKAK